MPRELNARLDLPWRTPKLSPNNRMHWRVRARETRSVREQTGWIAKAAKLTPRLPIAVTLHYRPARNGRRDPGNLCLDSKASIDGLVDAGLAPDDTPQYIRETIPEIHPAEPGQGAALWLELTWTEED